MAQKVLESGFRSGDVPLTAPAIRRKLWLIVQDLLEELADETGCLFLSVPEDVMDQNGFLREEYWYPDITHANRLYGTKFWFSNSSKVGIA